MTMDDTHGEAHHQVQMEAGGTMSRTRGKICVGDGARHVAQHK